MRSYFTKYAWGNTDLSNFLEEISQACSHMDAHAWADQWLRKAGLNTLRPVATIEGKSDGFAFPVSANRCTGGVIKSFKIEQTAPEDHPTLRSHYLEIGFYDTK